MPVINLPQDTRWGDIGKGLGNILGGVLTSYVEQQMGEQIGQLRADPNISEAKLPGEVLKKFGNKGIEVLAKLNALDAQSTQTRERLSAIGLNTIRQRLLEEQLPFEKQKQQADIGRTQALTAGTQAETAKTVATTQPTVAALNTQAMQRGAETLKTDVETDILRLKARGMEKALEGGGAGNLETYLAPFNLSPQEKAAAETTYRGAELKSPGSGEAALSAYVRNLVSSRTKAEAVQPTPTDERRASGNNVEYAKTLGTFVQTMADQPGQTGLLTGAPIKAYLERKGIATGDEPLITMKEAQAQLVAQAARGGSMFISSHTINLGKDITPNISNSPLANVKAADMIADQNIAKAEARLSGFEGTSVNVKPIQAELAEWQKVKKLTSTLRSAVVDQGTPKERTVMFFAGAQVDPKSFRPLVREDDTPYEIVKGKTRTGRQLFEAARARNKDPLTLLNELRLGNGLSAIRG